MRRNDQTVILQISKPNLSMKPEYSITTIAHIPLLLVASENVDSLFMIYVVMMSTTVRACLDGIIKSIYRTIE